MTTVPFRLLVAALALSTTLVGSARERPNIILVMPDDQGWGQTGYYHHPVLKTPNLDAMAANGLRLDRFYAGAPVCSPTRASVLTGRANVRTGVESHGYALRLQEKVLPAALRDAGYTTGHFGKWHLDGLRGPGVPILESDPHHPGHFGFDEWVSVSNFFDRDPLMSREGAFGEFKGDSSEIIVDEAVKFIRRQVEADEPFFTVIWYGSPHDPWLASEEDRVAFAVLDERSQHHYGELVAMDRSIGTLRSALSELDVADNTLVWFNSDNGGLSRIAPDTVGGLRGFKGTMYEGGLRVPAVIEWPDKITAGRVTEFPAVTMDIFPTIADVLDLPASTMLEPLDGISLLPLFSEEQGPRARPIPFRREGKAALIDNDYKLVIPSIIRDTFELYNLKEDPTESKDLFVTDSETAERMVALFKEWNGSADRSVAGKDYSEGVVDPDHPAPREWMKTPEYAPLLTELRERWEYQSRIDRAQRELTQAIRATNGIVEIEAEDGRGNWIIIDSPTGKAIQDPGRGRMRYDIIFDEPGKYYVFLLAKEERRGGEGENGVLLNLDGRKLYGSDDQTRPVGIGSDGGWKWTNTPASGGVHAADDTRDGGVYFLVEKQGHYTLEIEHRNADILIDKVLMRLNDSKSRGGSVE